MPDRHASATIHKPLAELVQPHRMAVVLLHELLDRQQMWTVLEPEALCQPDLFVERENLLRHPRMKMHEGPHAPQKLACLAQRSIILSGEDAPIRQVKNRCGLMPGHPGPLEQVEVP